MEKISPEKTTASTVEFLRNIFGKTGFSKAIVGVSGGVDSAVSTILTIKALGKDTVFPILMPCGLLSTDSTLDGMSFVQGLSVPMSNISRIDIKNSVDALSAQLGEVDNLRRGNLMARARMMVLFDQAKKRQALVVGTENRSEHLLGYFTRFGDEASDVEPIINLYKTQVYELARYLGVSEKILSKAPSAGLWPEQTDEKEFGFTYKDADEIMYLLFDEKKSIDEIIASGIDGEVVKKVKFRIDSNAFKHNLPHKL
ncbi:NAD+ synthase [Patescibacteria group bacterium]